MREKNHEREKSWERKKEKKRERKKEEEKEKEREKERKRERESKWLGTEMVKNDFTKTWIKLYMNDIKLNFLLRTGCMLAKRKQKNIFQLIDIYRHLYT